MAADPLLLGIVLFVVAVNMSTSDYSDLVVYPALVFTLWGVVSAGPWVTMQSSRLLARHAPGAAATLAARRLADNPRATFRTVSGVTVAVFIGTAVAGFLPSAVRAESSGERAPLTNVLRLRYDMGGTQISPAKSASVLADLRAMPGVSVIPVYLGTDTSAWNPDSGGPPPRAGSRRRSTSGAPTPRRCPPSAPARRARTSR
ncbi:hypothetical protein ACFQ9X_04700 [Catenulispora yoronensis]